ncbi:MAG TPA: type I phosphomannose isomerase catalytic subunit [Planctomycetaceae bacterium]|nr:type I phosphomannose isomerase catalytic subunit [Planctomycetaceae bacterium]
MPRTGAFTDDRPVHEVAPSQASNGRSAAAAPVVKILNRESEFPVAGAFPIAFAPQLKTHVWGGRLLADRLHKPLPTSELHGESWEISPLSQAPSVAAAQPWDGVTLAEMWSRYPMWRGTLLQSATQFPWLIKWLDCRDRLSVQVHPDAEASFRITGKVQPKNEAWVVVHAEPTARIWAGCRPGTTPEELANRLAAGTVVECLHEFTPQAGDCVYLPSGTLHAGGGGLLMAEVQQPSDLTFRLFDWNRVGLDGRPRELHIAAGLACLHWPQAPVHPVIPVILPESQPQIRGERLLSTPEFQMDRWTVSQPWSRQTDEFAVWMVLHGSGHLTCDGHERAVTAGETVWFPAVRVETTWQPTTDESLVLLKVTPPVTSGS